jgi:hypothetical protein
MILLFNASASALVCSIGDSTERIELKTLEDLQVKLPQYIRNKHPLFTDTARYKELMKSVKNFGDPEKRKTINIDKFILKNHMLILSITHSLKTDIRCTLNKNTRPNEKKLISI